MAYCPHCGDQDRTTRVGGVVRADARSHDGSFIARTSPTVGLAVHRYRGSRFGRAFSAFINSGSFSRGEFHIVSSSDLGDALRFPVAEKPGIAPFMLGGAALGAWCAVIFGVYGVLLLALFVIAYAVLALFLPGEVRRPGCLALVATALLIPALALEPVANAMTVFLFVLAPIGGTGLILLGVQQRRSYRKFLPVQEAAQRVWERSYYCGRDDVVFDPETGRMRHVENLEDLLYGAEDGVS